MFEVVSGKRGDIVSMSCSWNFLNFPSLETCYGNMICFPNLRRIKFPKNQELQKRFVSQALYFFVAVCCFLVCPILENMVRKQCFLVCPPLENMARKQCFLVCLPLALGAMARKHCQCFLVCALWANVAIRKKNRFRKVRFDFLSN